MIGIFAGTAPVLIVKDLDFKMSLSKISPYSLVEN